MVQLKGQRICRRNRRSRFRGGPLTAAAMCAALTLGSCGDSSPDYFPLEPGSLWIYEQTVLIDNHGNSGGRETRQYVSAATNLPARNEGETRLIPRVYSDGGTLYYEEAEDGIALAGWRGPYEAEIRAIEPRYVIKYPLETGTTWEKEGDTEILRRSFLGTFGTISKALRVEGSMRYEIRSVDDTVRVPAGVFRHCLRIEGEGVGHLAWGEPFGVLDVTVKTTEWYAPSVGLVKRVREETTGQGGPLGAHLEEQLAAAPESGWFH